MRVSVVHNRDAGRGVLARNKLVRALEDAGHEVVPNGEVVVAAGGDGTVTKVARRLVGGHRALAILPLGTANNLAHSIGHPSLRHPSSEDLLEGLLGVLALHDERALDVGVASGPWGKALFYEGAGVGLFADALEHVFTEEDKEHRTAARKLAAFLEHKRPRHYDIHLDSVDASGLYTMVEVMNVPMFGPNLHLSPGADPTDGLLDVALVTADETARLHRYLLAIADGGQPRPPHFDVQRARHVHLRLGHGRLRLDGDLHPLAGRRAYDHVDLRVRHGALRVWVPPQSRPNGAKRLAG